MNELNELIVVSGVRDFVFLIGLLVGCFVVVGLVKRVGKGD
jgi:hypothetical protein